jgi:hypothetical protein
LTLWEKKYKIRGKEEKKRFAVGGKKKAVRFTFFDGDILVFCVEEMVEDRS